MTEPNLGFDVEAATEILMSIGELILGNSAYQDTEWDALSLVVSMSEGSKSTFGYTYTDDGGWHPRRPSGGDVLNRIEEFRSATSVPGKEDWKAILIQIKKNDMSFNVDYKYDDADRWRITPANYEQRIEELRPQ
ncbi:hypothetical protein [Nocardia sp. R6R-6]|uniref:hypothetical protein n=1 Tax=Nocardia sp. R6R-6 TaxID=3459303 RepID=UPI00403DF312